MAISRAHPRTSQDALFELLHSEIRAGSENLSLWLKHIHSCGGAETLFELETWLRGLRSFFDLKRIPLGEDDRASLIDRSFAPELRIARHVIQTCEGCASELMKLGQPEQVQFERLVQGKLRRESVADSHVGRMLEQSTPLDSLGSLLEALNDLRVWMDSVGPGQANCRLYFSLARSYARGLRNCRFVDMLMSQKFKLQFDRVGNQALAALVRGVADDPLRRKLALAFLYLHRFLRYLELVDRDLANHRALRHNVVIFSLLHEETERFAEFLRANFLRGREHGHALRNAAELVVYSLRMESRRVLDRELIGVASETEIPVIFSKLENSHGLLRNCFRNSIVSLAQGFDPGFDARAIVSAEGFEKARRLQQDLWGLRQWIREALDRSRDIRLDDVLAQVSEFREHSLHNLMYQDWGEFERLSDALIGSSSQTEVRIHLKKFVFFVETLMHEVSKRSVLQETAPSLKADIE